MLKLAFALPLTLAAAVGHGSSTSTSAPAAGDAAGLEVDRPTCDVCDEVYDNCIAEGLTPAGCTRLVANCRKNCLP
ncbi:MAG TPA: hypothetical protein VIV58_39380 [Kofleriaceae bacterium]